MYGTAIEESAEPDLVFAMLTVTLAVKKKFIANKSVPVKAKESAKVVAKLPNKKNLVS